jgi:hypothetical protein
MNCTFVRSDYCLSIGCISFRTVEMEAADGMLHVKLILKRKGYRHGTTNKEEVVRDFLGVHRARAGAAAAKKTVFGVTEPVRLFVRKFLIAIAGLPFS